MSQYSTEFVPVVSDIVHPPVLVPVRVISFPSVPTAINDETVWVVPSVNFTVFGAFMVKVLKVFEPDTVSVPVPDGAVKL
jgi:hypothetical protein